MQTQPPNETPSNEADEAALKALFERSNAARTAAGFSLFHPFTQAGVSIHRCLHPLSKDTPISQMVDDLSQMLEAEGVNNLHDSTLVLALQARVLDACFNRLLMIAFLKRATSTKTRFAPLFRRNAFAPVRSINLKNTKSWLEKKKIPASGLKDHENANNNKRLATRSPHCAGRSLPPQQTLASFHRPPHAIRQNPHASQCLETRPPWPIHAPPEGNFSLVPRIFKGF